jgi:hypothetical protein
VLTGLTQAWDTGDPVTRRQLLRTLVAELDVKESGIVGYRPRPEVASEVIRYLEGWTPPGWESESGAGPTGPRAGENGIGNLAAAGFEATIAIPILRCRLGDLELLSRPPSV